MRNSSGLLSASLLGAALAFAPAGALAQTAYAVTSTNQLVRFDVSNPGTVVGSVAVTGLLGDSIVGIDFRPLTGQLFGLGGGSHLYVINTYTGVATQVGTSGAFTLAGGAFGFDVNPIPDRIRVASDTEQNMRLHPDTGGIAGTDVPLNYAPGDVNVGANPNVTGSAYTNNVAGAVTTTLYAIDTALDILAVQNPPNNGTLNTVGPLGYDTSGVVAFDIRTAAGVNTGYAAMRVDGISKLFTINLVTGAATMVGTLPSGMTITSLAVAPSPFKPATDLSGDYRSDILYRNTSTGQVWRMLMNGFTVSGAQMAYTEPNPAWKIVADADFNGDGRSDLLWRNSTTGQVYLMPFTSDGLPGPGSVIYTEPDAAWEIVQTPDLNGDGRADLVWVHVGTGQVYAMLFNGSAITTQGTVHIEPNPDWAIVASAGIAGGGGRQNQLVWRNGSTGQVYLMTVGISGSTFTTSGSIIYTEPNTQWQVVGAPDLDGDGQSDLVWRNAATGQVYGMLLNGGLIGAQGMIHVEPTLLWKIVAFGDYDGDGKADLLWRNESTGQLHMMRMSGLAIIDQATMYVEPKLEWKVMGPYEYAK